MSGADVEYVVDAREWIYALRQTFKFADGQDLERPSKKVTGLLYDDVEYTATSPTRRSYNRTFNLLSHWDDIFGGGGEQGVLVSFFNIGTRSPTGFPYARLVMSGKDQSAIHSPAIYWGDRTIEKTAERVAEDVPEIFASHFADYVNPVGKV